MEFLSQLDPQIVIQGGLTLGLLFALATNRGFGRKIAEMLENHLKHMQDNQDDDIRSREKLATTLEKLAHLIEKHIL